MDGSTKSFHEKCYTRLPFPVVHVVSFAFPELLYFKQGSNFRSKPYNNIITRKHNLHFIVMEVVT